MITGNTTHKLDLIRTYDNNNPYQVGCRKYDVTNPSVCVVNVLIVNTDPTSGQLNNVTYNVGGIQYVTTFLQDGNTETTFSFNPSPIVEDDYFIFKDEINMGVVFSPKIEEELFIDRKPISVFEPHIRLSNITTLEQLERYNNGYYNVIKN